LESKKTPTKRPAAKKGVKFIKKNLKGGRLRQNQRTISKISQFSSETATHGRKSSIRVQNQPKLSPISHH